MPAYILIFLGSGLGGVLRYLVSAAIDPRLASGFPWATFLVNVSGSFLIGFLAGLLASSGRPWLDASTRSFLITGVLGGYTTYSAFSLQTLTLAQAGSWLQAGAYAGGTFVLCFVAVWLGAACAAVLNTTRG